MNDFLPESLRTSAQAWAQWMTGMSWQVAVLAGVVALVSYALRRHSARLRYALWAVVLLKLLLPPTLALPTGYGWWLRPAVAPDAASSSPLKPTPTSASTNELTTRSSTTNSATSNATQSSIARHTLTEQSAAAPMPSPTSWWPTMLFVAWSAFVAARLLMLVAGAVRVRQWIARAHDVVEPRVIDCFDAARQRVGISRDRGPRVELRESDSCATPLVVGLWRPTILLPLTVMQQLDDAELEAVLVHELVHVRRRDAWFRLAQSLLETTYFFHPVVWWAGRELRALREDACDEATVALLSGRRKAYGSALVKTASGVGYEPPHLALAALDSRSTLKRRLLRVLDPRLPLEGPSWIASVLAVGLVTIIFIPAGNTTERPRQLDEPSTAAIANEQSSNQIDGSPEETSGVEPPPAPIDPQLQTQTETPPIFPNPPTSTPRATPNALRRLPTEVERLAWMKLDSPDSLARAEAYATLREQGTAASLEKLEQRYLTSTGIDEVQSKEALDAIWNRIRSQSPKTSVGRDVNRVFESPDPSRSFPP